MPQQLVNVVQVHVVVVHLVVALWIPTDIAIRIHLCPPLFLGTSQALFFILRRMGILGRNVVDLTLGISVEMADSTLGPTQHIAQIARTPACQRHSPANAAMQPRLAVPVALGSNHQGATQRVDIGIGRIELYTGAQLSHRCLQFLKTLSAFSFVGFVCCDTITTYVTLLIERLRPLLDGCLAISLEGLTRIDTQIAITRQFGITNAAHHHIQCDVTIETRCLKTPHSLLCLQRCYYFDTQCGFLTPRFMAQQVTTHPVFITCFAKVGLIKQNAIHTKLHITAIVLLV